MEWASLHQEELMQDWDLARRQAELNKIAPLEQIMFGVDVTHVQPFEGRRLQVTFSDGVTAVLEMDRVLKHGYAGVFSPLMDEANFTQVRVDSELGTTVWPNGADVCPDVLHSHATGEPIVVNGERVLN
jgi:hypothetical protein